MKDLVIKKPFGTKDLYFITQEIGDDDTYALVYYDEKLDITLKILSGGDTDGGSIPNPAKIFFDPLLDRTAHAYIFHDEIWRHRYYYSVLFQQLGLTFTESNRIMRDIMKAAGVSWLKRNTARLSVRWGGYYKWTHPENDIIVLKEPTLEVVGGRDESNPKRSDPFSGRY